MAKHKIIPVNSESAEAVALNLVRNDEGNDVVQISAWHLGNDNTDLRFQEQFVDLGNAELGEQFINDFSAETAEIFVDGFHF